MKKIRKSSWSSLQLNQYLVSNDWAQERIETNSLVKEYSWRKTRDSVFRRVKSKIASKGIRVKIGPIYRSLPVRDILVPLKNIHELMYKREATDLQVWTFNTTCKYVLEYYAKKEEITFTFKHLKAIRDAGLGRNTQK